MRLCRFFNGLFPIFFQFFTILKKIEFFYSLNYFYRNNRYHRYQFRKPNIVFQNIKKLIPNHYATANTGTCVPKLLSR